MDLDDLEAKARAVIAEGTFWSAPPCSVGASPAFIAAANPAAILDLVDRLRKAEGALDEEFNRGRLLGRKDVAKYSEAIAEIEKAIGTEAVPLRQTVLGVRRLRYDRDAVLAEVRRLRSLLREATLFVRDAQDLIDLDEDDWASGEDFLSRARAALEPEPDGD